MHGATPASSPERAPCSAAIASTRDRPFCFATRKMSSCSARDRVGPREPRGEDERQPGPLEPVLGEIEAILEARLDVERGVADDERAGAARSTEAMACAGLDREEMRRELATREEEPREDDARARRQIERDRVELVERALARRSRRCGPCRARRWPCCAGARSSPMVAAAATGRSPTSASFSASARASSLGSREIERRCAGRPSATPRADAR